jgi:D-alanyl-D-alanine carboxypeptidase (penicillin-binding protein 5/6)
MMKNLYSNRIISLFFLSFFLLSNASAASPVPAAPKVSAKSYILQDFASGNVLASKNPTERVEPASITKLMSAYVIFNEIKEGRLKLTDQVIISKKAWQMPGSRTFVEVNKKVPVEVLLKGIIVQSGNDATVALAEHVAGSEDTFASLMNQYALKLGMVSTNFVNSTGLPNKDHYSTAEDIARLSAAVIRDHPKFYSYYSIKKFVYNNIPQYNRNKLLWRDKSVDGIKTGHTDAAGYCLASSAERDNMRLIAVVLGDRSEDARANSSRALLNYGFRFFESRQLYKAGKSLKQIRIWKGDQEMLDLGLRDDMTITYPAGNYKKLNATIDVRSDIAAPVKKGQRLGTLNISLDGNVIADAPLIALQEIETGSLWRQGMDAIQLWFQ